MTADRDKHADGLMSEDKGGWMSNFLADEDELDRRALWRLGSWGVGTVGVLIAGILAAQSPLAERRDQLASADLVKQSQQLQWIAKESQNQARQLAAAVEVLNSDRDRLYARVTVLEQGLDSVTGSIARQSAAAAQPPVAPPSGAPPSALSVLPDSKSDAPPPKIAPVASVPSPAPVVANRQSDRTPDKPEPAATGAVSANDPIPTDAAGVTPVQPTEFGVDLGTATSVEGLRALWRGVSKANAAQLASLTPIIVVKERTDGLGMQLRLVAGPLTDAAAAAKICATLTENKRACDTSTYDGQRLALQADKKPDGATSPQKRKVRGKPEETPAASRGSFSSIFGFR
jgi:hypothetical protein